MFLAWSFGDWLGSMTVGSRYYRSETQRSAPLPIPHSHMYLGAAAVVSRAPDSDTPTHHLIGLCLEKYTTERSRRHLLHLKPEKDQYLDIQRIL